LRCPSCHCSKDRSEPLFSFCFHPLYRAGRQGRYRRSGRRRPFGLLAQAVSPRRLMPTPCFQSAPGVRRETPFRFNANSSYAALLAARMLCDPGQERASSLLAPYHPALAHAATGRGAGLLTGSGSLAHVFLVAPRSWNRGHNQVHSFEDGRDDLCPDTQPAGRTITWSSVEEDLRHRV